MKLVATQENLSHAVSLMSRVAGGRNPLPVLSNILLKTVKKQLVVSATNLEIAITQTVGAKVEEDGAITVPARLTSDFIASLPKEAITLEVDGSKLKVSTDNYSSVINGIPAEEFPSIPKIAKRDTISIEASRLKTALQQTLVACSTDETRPVLTGVYLHSYNNVLYATATDSYRLAEKRIAPTDATIACVVPASALGDLVRILSDSKTNVALLYDEAQALFRYESTELVTRLVEGTFPDYRQLIPDQSASSFYINREEFINITKVAGLFARESAGSISLKVDAKAKELSISSVATQVGESTSVVKVRSEGSSAETTLNSRYLLDALNVMEGEEVRFRFSDSLGPCVLEPGGNGTDYRHIIMPLKS